MNEIAEEFESIDKDFGESVTNINIENIQVNHLIEQISFDIQYIK